MLLQLLLLLLAFVLIAGTYVYVAAEFSLVTVDRAAVAQRAAAGDGRAVALQSGLRTLSTQLSGAQVGITVTTLALGFVMEPSLAGLLERPLVAWGLSSEAAESLSVPVALVVATLLSMIFGELVPKSAALADPMGTALAVVRPLRWSSRVFRPLVWALNGIANGVLALVGIEPQEELRSARSPAELRSLVRRSEQAGTLPGGTAGLLARSLDFAGKTAADVLTPRVRMRSVPVTATAADLIAVAARSGHSRFPVLGTDSDDVRGLVHVKRAVAVPVPDRTAVTVDRLMVDAPLVPQTLPLPDLLDVLRGRGLQLAVVVDEFGGTAGLLTLEDVVEELIGEITDEHDVAGARPRRRTDGVWQLPGVARPDEVAQVSGVALPESPTYETVAGLLLAGLGRLARPGDSVVVPAVVDPERDLGVLSADLDPDVDRELYERDRALAGSDGPVPRPYLVRLTVARAVGRRIDGVLLSACGPVP